MQNVVLEFKKQKVSVKLADKPNEFRAIKNLEDVFGLDKLPPQSDSEDRMTKALRILYSSVSTFWTMCQEDIARIYYNKALSSENKYDEVNEVGQEILKLVTGDNTFMEGSKEREIFIDIAKQYEVYQKAMQEYLSFDANGFPLFRAKPEQPKIEQPASGLGTKKAKELFSEA